MYPHVGSGATIDVLCMMLSILVGKTRCKMGKTTFLLRLMSFRGVASQIDMGRRYGVLEIDVAMKSKNEGLSVRIIHTYTCKQSNDKE